MRPPHARPIVEEPKRESLAMALLGAASVSGFAAALFFLLWALKP